MIQLLIPSFMIRYSIIMLVLCQIIFLMEYIFHLIKTYNYSDDKITLIKLFIPYDSDSKNISIEYLLYIVVYCYYAQYQLYNYEFYQKLIDDKNISLSIYIEIKLSEFPLIKKILFCIGLVILELYKWSLIGIFIVFDSYFEISLFFSIKLLLFLIIIYQYLQIIRNNTSVIKNIILNWIFLIFCALNTLAIYTFQFLCLHNFSYNDKIKNSSNFFIKNLPALGLYRYYEQNLQYKFMPHFVSNLISVLFIAEMKRLLKEIREKEKRENGEIDFDKIDDTKNKLLLKKKSLKLKNIDSIIVPKEEEKKEIKEEDKEDLKDINKIIVSSDSNIIDNNEINTNEIDTNENDTNENDTNENNTNENNTNEININENDTNEINTNEINTNEIKEENEKKDNDNDNEEEGQGEQKSASEEYEYNKKKMDILNLKYYWFNIVLTITKFYWLFLFLSICIIFTTYDLSIIIIAYILIFGITFIRMFRHIISHLTNYINHESFFISKLIRYNLIEQARHIKENEKYRALAFKYLLIFSFTSYYLFYLNGIFYIIQNGCPADDCDKNYEPIDSIDNDLIISISYLFGFNINHKKESVLFAGWVHLFFSAMICFDVYVQKLEIYCNQLSEKNRKKYRKLANKNIQIKALTYGEANFLMNISSGVEALKQHQIEEEEKKFKKIKYLFKKKTTIKFSIDTKNEEEDKEIGKKLIDDFLLIFNRASRTDVKLSKSKKKYLFIKICKNIFEEIIIFLLICTAISKLNIWSFVYMLYALYLILTEKSMQKYYVLYCFIIATILLQSVIFISNVHMSTDPNPDEEAINIMNKKFHIPWYKKNNNTTDYEPIINISDQKAFFFGLGVSHSQINLIWMDFIEVVIIYIYLEYFSYSIYQSSSNTNTKIKSKKNNSKINYYNLYLNSQVREVTSKLSKEEYQKHKECMKYNFDLDILKYEDFKHYMKYGKRRIIKNPDEE